MENNETPENFDFDEQSVIPGCPEDVDDERRVPII